jgi:hypothetical protein
VTLAVRNALAYIAISGNTPTGTHMATRLAALQHCDDDPTFEKTGRFYRLTSDAEALLDASPLWRVYGVLRDRGFRFIGNTRVRNGRICIERNLRFLQVGDEGHGWEAEVEPTGTLYLSRVIGGAPSHKRGDTGYVSAKEAGTLPPIYFGA